MLSSTSAPVIVPPAAANFFFSPGDDDDGTPTDPTPEVEGSDEGQQAVPPETDDGLFSDIPTDGLSAEAQAEVEKVRKQLLGRFTQKSQAMAEERKQTQAMQAVADELAAFGITPTQLAETLEAYQQNPAQFQQQPAQAQANIDNDPDLLEAAADYQLLVEQFGAQSYEARSAARQYNGLREVKLQSLTLSQLQHQTTSQARTSALTSELSGLMADPLYSVVLAAPKAQRAAMRFAAEKGVTVEQATHAIFGRNLIEAGQQRGRGLKAGGAAATAQRGTSTTKVTTSQAVPHAVAVKGLDAIAEWIDAHE